MIFTLWSSFGRVMSYFSCSALYKAIYPRSSVWMRTAFKCVLDMFCQCLLHCNRKAIRFWLRAMLLLRPRIGSYRLIASIFLLLYLYFVYNVIFLPSKKLILCCYPCLVMLFMIKNLARKRNKPLQCVGLR